MEIASVVGDPRFFARSGPHALPAIAAAVSGEVDPATPDDGRMLHQVGPLQLADAATLSFLDNRKYLSALQETRAGAVIVHPDMRGYVPAGCIAILTREPYLGWARAAKLFFPPPSVVPGVHPSAIVDSTAIIHPSAEIGPLVVVGARAEIGARVRIAASAVVGDAVAIGEDTRIGALASISHAIIGARVHIFPGVRIGQEGFGFATAMTPRGPHFETVSQLGRVLIGDDVEIGANSCIDRGSVQDTVIGSGTRIDNLVQIGHNVCVGRCCVLVAQVGISGSTVLEDFVVAAGQSGFAGHLRIGRGARIGGQAGVISDVPAGAEYLGMPAGPKNLMFRQIAWLKRQSGTTRSALANSSNTTDPGRADDRTDSAAGPD